MSQPPITAEQLAGLPLEFQALLGTVVEHYERGIATLKARVAELEARLGNRHRNSHQQNTSVFDFVTQAVAAHFAHRPAPSLLARV
jgi:hypothetical protein